MTGLITAEQALHDCRCRPGCVGCPAEAVGTVTTVQEFDADLDHPWAKNWRIPLVQSPWPGWKYEVALVVPPPPGDYDLDKATWPTEDEALVVHSLIEYRMTYYNAGWSKQMRERALDVDSSTNTVILLKRADGWYYRLETWRHGVWPFYDTPADVRAPFTPDKAGLIALIDKYKTICDEVYYTWRDWKAAHPEVFA